MVSGSQSAFLPGQFFPALTVYSALLLIFFPRRGWISPPPSARIP